MKPYIFLGIGNALLDIIVQTTDADLAGLRLDKGTMKLIDLEEFKRTSAFAAAAHAHYIPAGSVGNMAKIAAMLRQSPVFFGSVGKDEQGDRYQKGMQDLGVEVRLMRHATLATGTCTSLVTPDGERTMLTYLGAANSLSLEAFPTDVLSQVAFVVVEGYQLATNGDFISRTVHAAYDSGARVAIDLSDPFVARASKSAVEALLPQVDILFANEQEALFFTEEKNAHDALQALAKRISLPVVKLGKQGAMAMWRGKVYRVGTSGLAATDSTGAGDAFAAGFLTGCYRDMPVTECLKLANDVAEEMIRIYGTDLDPKALAPVIQAFGLNGPAR